MGHLNEGTLRRLYDEPLAVSDAERTHYAGCQTCRREFAVVAADARATGTVLAGASPEVDAAAALRRFRATENRQASPAPRRSFGTWLQSRPRAFRPLAAGLVAVAMVGVLAATGVAQNLFDLIQPTSVAVVPISSTDLRALPDLSRFGTTTVSGGKSESVAGAAAAAAVTGFAVPKAGSLPSGVGQGPKYTVMPTSTGTFTFNAEMARAEAAREGKTIPAMPAGMDGSTLIVTVGPAVLELYGDIPQDGSQKVGQILAIGKMQAPRVQSTGVTLAQLEGYLAAMPGVSPQLAAQIKAIGDPSATLPIPVPVDRASAQQVTVQGVQGIAIGDSTGLGSGVIWIKDGFVYGVAGTFTQDQVLAVANSLA